MASKKSLRHTEQFVEALDSGGEIGRRLNFLLQEMHREVNTMSSKSSHQDLIHTAVDAKEDEAIVFSWIEWPDKAAADASWEKMQNDPAMKKIPEMPFDGSRMIYGGFDVLALD